MVCTKKIKCIGLALILAGLHAPLSHAAWQTSGEGFLDSVRTYKVGTDGLRVQIKTNPAAQHTCGTAAEYYYFDSTTLPLSVVNSVLSMSLSAMLANKPVKVTYDCNAGTGGHGWGTAIQVNAE